MVLAKDTLVDGKFRVIRALGMGGYGVVYETQQESFDRRVALKILDGSRFDKEAAQRFEREARALTALHHRNIVMVYGFGIWQEQPYFAMEYLQGQNLHQLVAHDGPLSPRRSLALMQQLLDALQCAHEHGIVHRDLKPGNMIICADHDGEEILKLVDFGLAAVVTPDPALGVQQRLTGANAVLGTPSFMSPEQIKSEPVDARSDVYSAACVMYWCLAGKALFDGAEQVAILQQHLYEEPAFDDSLIPADIRDVLETALAKDPAQRYQSAADMAAALRKCDSSNQRHSRAWRILMRQLRRKEVAQRGTLALVSLAVLAIGSTATYLTLRQQAVPEVPPEATPEASQMILDRARTLSARGQFQEAQAVAVEALKKDAIKVKDLHNRDLLIVELNVSNLALQTRRYDIAIDLYTDLTKAMLENSRFWRLVEGSSAYPNLTTAYLNSGDQKNALLVAQEFASLMAKRAPNSAQEGIALLTLYETQHAIDPASVDDRLVERAMALAPTLILDDRADLYMTPALCLEFEHVKKITDLDAELEKAKSTIVAKVRPLDESVAAQCLQTYPPGGRIFPDKI